MTSIRRPLRKSSSHRLGKLAMVLAIAAVLVFSQNSLYANPDNSELEEMTETEVSATTNSENETEGAEGSEATETEESLENETGATTEEEGLEGQESQEGEEGAENNLEEEGSSGLSGEGSEGVNTEEGTTESGQTDGEDGEEGFTAPPEGTTGPGSSSTEGGSQPGAPGTGIVPGPAPIIPGLGGEGASIPPNGGNENSQTSGSEQSTEESNETEATTTEAGDVFAWIGGFLWVDGNGSLPTDWDGLFNGKENPLVGYPVHLFAANNLKNPIASTTTQNDGSYVFDIEAAGDYVVGFASEKVGGVEYLLPMMVTKDNKFAINWTSVPLRAFTEKITVQEGKTKDGYNAGLRLPMGIAPASLGSNYGGYIVTDVIDGGNLTVTTPGKVYEIIGSGGPIVVNVDTVLVLNNATRTHSSSPLLIQGTAKCTIYLVEGTTNYMTSNGTILQNNAGISVAPNAALIIDGPGFLGAVGGESSAGIGGYINARNGSITILNGDINARGSMYAAGIGSGRRDGVAHFSAGPITINGGRVEAMGGYYAAGIGGGYASSGGTTTINNGTVIAHGGNGGAGIGGGYNVSTLRDADGGTIIINAGHVSAYGGHASAGIGGGCGGYGGIIKINGGTVVAEGSANSGTRIGGAGIGGGGMWSTSYTQGSSSGYIYITGGTVTATSYGSSAGIGGGYEYTADYIEISGGIVAAEAKGNGAGIGAGGKASCGTINISGGTIYAQGSSDAAGIGSGASSASKGTINISGGMVNARGSSTTSSGVGGGTNSTVDVNITGGSVYSINTNNMIRVNFNPTNGAANGKMPVYLVNILLTDEMNTPLPFLNMSINVTNSQGAVLYNYFAMTNEVGHVYMWLPANVQNYHLVYNPANGAYVDDIITVNVPQDPTQYDPNTSTRTLTLPNDSPAWSLSLNSGNTKVYGSATLHLNIDHNNQVVVPVDKRQIAGVKWFRESVEGPIYTQGSFNAGYAAASDANRGEGGVGEALELSSTSTNHLQNYDMNITKNGRYWVQINYKGANTGKDIYHVAYLDVSSIYTPIELFVRDRDTNLNTVGAYYKIGNSPYGICYDYDGTTLLTTLSQGRDTVTYYRNYNFPVTYWNIAVPGLPFAGVAQTGSSSVITLDENLGVSADAAYSTATQKYYTVDYTRNNNWSLLKAYYVTSNGNEVAVPQGSSSKSISFWVPLDANGYTATNFAGNGGFFMPPYSSEGRAIGWYIADKPHRVASSELESGTNPSQFFAQSNFANFNPSLSFSNTSNGTLADGKYLYIVYTTSYMIEVSVPMNLMFAAFESKRGEVIGPVYTIQNNGDTEVKVSVVDFHEGNESAGLNVTNNPVQDGDLGLSLRSKNAPMQFSDIPLITSGMNELLGYLGNRGVNDGSNEMKLTLTGRYVGGFGDVKTPDYSVVFEFAIATP
ncbi:MAG: hypothetical protein FWE65_00800 [Eggerthellaceae bacterium]|nr:hypothetical protein [Eggerthellaceae bacterium]